MIRNQSDESRGSFLKKIFIAAGAIASAGIFGKTLQKLLFNDKKEKNMSSSGITSVRPLNKFWVTKDPFLYCAYHVDKYPAGNSAGGPNVSLQGRRIGQDFEGKDGWRMYHGKSIPGFPNHPHRGFETVTVVQKGFVDHSDSLGSSGRYGMGDVQWMTAGKGVQHAEMFPLLNQDKDNTMEVFQIWLNLPSRKKMTQPFYKMLWAEKIPVATHKDNHDKISKIKLIAGTLDSQTALAPAPDSWASDPENHIAIWTIEMEPNAEWTLPSSAAGLNKTLYFYEGSSLQLNGTDITVMNSADLISESEIRIINGSSPAKLLLLQGKPIREPVVQYGPFVMNTEEEIEQAFYDYRKTQFGGWPWNTSEPVHEKSKGRFSRLSNGEEERA